MFYTLIDKGTFDQIMSLYFRNLCLIDQNADLVVRSLSFEDGVVVVEADVEQETLQ